MTGTTPNPPKFYKNAYGLAHRIGSALLDTGISSDELPDPSAKGGGQKCQELAEEVADFAADRLRGVRGPTVVHDVVSGNMIVLKPINGKTYYLVILYNWHPGYGVSSALNAQHFVWCVDKNVRDRLLNGWKDLWRSGVRSLAYAELNSERNVEFYRQQLYANGWRDREKWDTSKYNGSDMVLASIDPGFGQ
jgi:hypothetical protein